MAELGIGTVDGVKLNRVLGYGNRVGSGPKLYKYIVYIEPGISTNIDKFVNRIEKTLGDKRGWIRGGKVSFQRVPAEADTHVILARPNTVDKLCAPLQTEGKVSCNQGNKVVINVVRWKKGVPHWTGGIKTYRQMLINHEMGHRTGQNHRFCTKPGALAPVMQQQTYGLQGCKENSWPLDTEL